MAYLAQQYFSTLCYEWQDFLKNVTEHKTCFEFLCNLAWNISHSKISEWQVIKMYIVIHVKNLLFLSDFNP